LLTGKHACLDIKLHGADTFHELIAAGSSSMILGSHLGSFEVLRSIGGRQNEIPIRVLIRQEQNPVISEFLNCLNRDVANLVIPLGRPNSMLLVKEAVEKGHLIGLLGDRPLAGEKIHVCNFFGKQASFPTGPMTLAMILRIPVYLAFGIYQGGNRYDIHFELLSDVIETARNERETSAARLIERFAARLEHFARRSPYNWFNFYDFWDTSQEPLHSRDARCEQHREGT
jgi:predicted LPLAT superfamily acyltransferase